MKELIEVPRFKRYLINRQGEVYSIAKKWKTGEPKRLKSYQNCWGHWSVCLTNDAGLRRVFVHRILLEVFIGPPPTPVHQARHLDGNPSNNNLGNLLWGTPSENGQDRTRHGRCAAARNGRTTAWRKVGTGRGATFEKRTGKWWTGVRIDGKYHHLGTFKTELEAIAIYKLESARLLQESGHLTAKHLEAL